MTDERSKSMAERVAHLEQENARIARFHADRELSAGRLSPRQRISALLDDGSFVELARLAHSQQESVAAQTAGDGVLIGYGTVREHPVAVLCEDPIALAETDAQVAKNKRIRIIDHAVFRRLPLIYLADGRSNPAPTYPAGEGLLIPRIADQKGARTIDERRAPFVAIVLGPCADGDAALMSRADVVVASPRGRIRVGSGWAAPAAFADIHASDDAGAIDAARAALDLLLLPQPADQSFAVPSAESLDDSDGRCDPARFVAGVADAGSVVPLTASAGQVTALVRIGGLAAAVVATAGGPTAELSEADLTALERLATLCERFRVPLIVTQDCAGYGAGEQDARHVRVLGEVAARLRAGVAAKITLVTGAGRVLGDHVLGGAGLSFDLTWAWPSARIPLTEVEALADAPAGPWPAADFGLLDDVITPSQTRAALADALRLLAPCRNLPVQHVDRGLHIYDVV